MIRKSVLINVRINAANTFNYQFNNSDDDTIDFTPDEVRIISIIYKDVTAGAPAYDDEMMLIRSNLLTKMNNNNLLVFKWDAENVQQQNLRYDIKNFSTNYPYRFDIFQISNGNPVNIDGTLSIYLEFIKHL